VKRPVKRLVALPVALAALLAAGSAGCPGTEHDAPAEIESALPSAPTDQESTTAAAPNPEAWPGADRAADGADRAPPIPRVVVASSGPSGSSAAAAAQPPANSGVDCVAIVDHIYDVLKKEMPAVKSDTLREREQTDREHLAKMCPARATPAFEKCVLAQKSIAAILRCDPITGATNSAASALLKDALGKVELDEADDGIGDSGRKLPQPLDLPDPVYPQ